MRMSKPEEQLDLMFLNLMRGFNLEFTAAGGYIFRTGTNDYNPRTFEHSYGTNRRNLTPSAQGLFISTNHYNYQGCHPEVSAYDFKLLLLTSVV